jgi:hypothetical protein
VQAADDHCVVKSSHAILAIGVTLIASKFNHKERNAAAQAEKP